MFVLRRTIRQIIKEIYELSDEEYEKSLGHGSGHKRIFGLQTPEEQREDRAVLQEYQNKIRNTPEGKRMIKAFMSGQGITTFHAINYVSYADELDGKRPKENASKNLNLFKAWIEDYGMTGKDVLSTVAHVGKPGDIDLNKMKENNSVIVEGIGFIMKGYPVIVSRTDVDSQTLGALPAGLVKHQAQSGVAKRAGRKSQGEFLYSLEDINNVGYAGEVLLDNWKIDSMYLNFWAFELIDMPSDMEEYEYAIMLIDEIRNMGFDLHLYDGYDYLGVNLSKEETDELAEELVE